MHCFVVNITEHRRYHEHYNKSTNYGILITRVSQYYYYNVCYGV